MPTAHDDATGEASRVARNATEDAQDLRVLATRVDKLLDQVLPQAGKLVLDIGLVNDLALQTQRIKTQRFPEYFKK